MGTKIIEQGSTAGGIAKVEYLDESGNVLYEVNDSDKIFKMVNGKISGLAGTGTRMVVADSSGNLSVLPGKEISNMILTETYQACSLPPISIMAYNWVIRSGTSSAFLQSTHNDYTGYNVFTLFTGPTVTEVLPNTAYSFRLADSVVEIKVDMLSGITYLKINSGTSTDIKIERIRQNI